MVIAHRVNQLITSCKPQAVCDDCIVEAAGLRSHAHSSQITAALGTTSDFDRERGICSLCHSERMVIRAVR